MLTAERLQSGKKLSWRGFNHRTTAWSRTACATWCEKKGFAMWVKFQQLLTVRPECSQKSFKSRDFHCFPITNDSHPLHFHPISLNQMTIAEIIRCTWSVSPLLSSGKLVQCWRRAKECNQAWYTSVVAERSSDYLSLLVLSWALLLCLEGMNKEENLSLERRSRLNVRKSISSDSKM